MAASEDNMTAVMNDVACVNASYQQTPALTDVACVNSSYQQNPSADFSTVFPPMEWVAVAIPIEQFDFENWGDTSNTCMYYPEAQVGEFYGEMDQGVCHGQTSTGPLAGRVWQLSKDSKKCRLVQDAFDEASCDEERIAIASELVGHVWESLKCMNANHVIQKCISTIRPDMAQFVIDELSQYGPKGVMQAAHHRFGCRILQRLLEHCSEEQMAPIVEVLLNSALDLSSHTYGHYVMMHLFEHCGPDVISRLAIILQQHVSSMAPDGYVGAVISKALAHSNNEACQSLAVRLLQELAPVIIMACSRWGYLAVKQALQLVPAPEQEKACSELARCSGKLRSSRYGRLVATHVTELQSFPALRCH